MKKNLKFIGLFTCIMLSSFASVGQTKKVTLNGTGRSIMFHDKISTPQTDTITANQSFTGYALMDIAFNIKPNKATQIESVMRLRNEFGGFYGTGVSLEIRKLFIEGLIKNQIKYRVGDYNFNLSPYTLYNNEEEGFVNEPTIFEDFRSINHYESFYDENTWRQQGASLEFVLEAEKGFEEMEFMAFVSRTRSVRFFTSPDQFFGGLNYGVKFNDLFNAGLTYVRLFEVAETAGIEKASSNSVLSFNGSATKMIEETKVTANGEFGFSNLNFKNDTLAPSTLEDFFYDIGIGVELKNGFKATLAYRDVGPNFNSAGAQTRRINYGQPVEFFNQYSNNQINREISMFDMIYGQSMFNKQIIIEQDTFNQKYTNAEPFGKATPNRTGLTLDVAYNNHKETFGVFATTTMLNEVVGEGTQEKRSFLKAKVGGDISISKLASFNKNITLNFGVGIENTTRGGSSIEKIDLSSTLLEAGLDIELFKNFDLLVGVKSFSSEGNEYLSVKNIYNEISYYSLLNYNQNELLNAIGLKYRFSENIYLTAQYVNTAWNDKLNFGRDYRLNRFLVVYNMTF